MKREKNIVFVLTVSLLSLYFLGKLVVSQQYVGNKFAMQWEIKPDSSITTNELIKNSSC